MHSHWSQLAVFAAVILSGIGYTTAVSAAPQTACFDAGLCGKTGPLSALQLAAVTGKFSVAGQVVGMNLHMISAWQTADGQRLDGSANVSIALPTSRVSVRTQANVSEAALTKSSGVGSVRAGSGLQGTVGAQQLVQIAGDNNSARNSSAIDISQQPNAIDEPALDRHAQAIAGNGARVHVEVGQRGIQMALEVPNTGEARQALQGGGGPALSQSIQIAADRQQVVNQLQLQLQVQAPTRAALAADGFNRAINALRGQ